jgi:hypothetical protein
LADIDRTRHHSFQTSDSCKLNLHSRLFTNSPCLQWYVLHQFQHSVLCPGRSQHDLEGERSASEIRWKRKMTNRWCDKSFNRQIYTVNQSKRMCDKKHVAFVAV